MNLLATNKEFWVLQLHMQLVHRHISSQLGLPPAAQAHGATQDTNMQLSGQQQNSRSLYSLTHVAPAHSRNDGLFCAHGSQISHICI